MNKQEIKIVDTSTGNKVFFFAHSFKSAIDHANEYVDRNISKFPMNVYDLSVRPAPSPKWNLIKVISLK